MSDQQGLYILSIPGDYYKVGIAHDVQQRIKLLQTGCPEKITIYAWYDVADSGVRASEMEGQMHDLLYAYWTSGEWFHAPKAVIDAAFREAWFMFINPKGYERLERWRARARAKRMAERLPGFDLRSEIIEARERIWVMLWDENSVDVGSEPKIAHDEIDSLLAFCREVEEDNRKWK